MKTVGKLQTVTEEKLLKSKVFPFLISGQKKGWLVNILALFSKRFPPPFKGKMFLETPNLAFPRKNAGNPAWH